MWMENEFEIEQALEEKQIREDIQAMYEQDHIPNWDFLDDED